MSLPSPQRENIPSPQGNSTKRSLILGNTGDPNPLTGSHPFAALNPPVPHPGLLPSTIYHLQSALTLLLSKSQAKTHIIKNFRMLIQNRIQKPNNLLPSQQSLIINSINHRSEQRCRGTRSSANDYFSLVHDRYQSSQECDVGVCAARSVKSAIRIGRIIGSEI